MPLFLISLALKTKEWLGVLTALRVKGRANASSFSTAPCIYALLALLAFECATLTQGSDSWITRALECGTEEKTTLSAIHHDLFIALQQWLGA